MSDELSRTKAEWRVAKLDQRARLLQIIRGTHLKHRLFLSPLLIALGVIVLACAIIPRILPLSVFDSGSGPLLLAVGFIVFLALEVASLRKRMDALVAILNEDGVLQSDPPVVKILDK